MRPSPGPKVRQLFWGCPRSPRVVARPGSLPPMCLAGQGGRGRSASAAGIVTEHSHTLKPILGQITGGQAFLAALHP